MEFRKTNDGRVFFQAGAQEQTDNAASTAQAQPARKAIRAANHPDKSDMILNLLGKLSGQLKRSEQNRDSLKLELQETRKILAELEDRNDRGEKAYLRLEQKLSRLTAEKASTTDTVRTKELEQQILETRKTLKAVRDKTLTTEKTYHALEQKLARRESDQRMRVQTQEKFSEDMLKELRETRKIMVDLEDQTERSRKTVLSVEQKIALREKAEQALREKQAQLEKLQKEQEEKLTNDQQKNAQAIALIRKDQDAIESLNDKLEELILTQQRVTRRLDKDAQDKTRLLRKIERLEETAMETQDALRSKAMVLLTDQDSPTGKRKSLPAYDDEQFETSSGPMAITPGAATGYEADRIFAEQIEKDLAQSKPWAMPNLSGLVTKRTAGLTAMLVVAVLGSWAISEMQNPEFSWTDPSSYQIAALRPSQPFKSRNITDIQAQPDVDPVIAQTDLTDFFDPVAPVAETQNNLIASIPEDDLGANNAMNIDNILDVIGGIEDPTEADLQQIAANLNALEPGVGNATQEPSEIIAVPRDPDDVPLAERITPDPDLPEIVKDIEAKAYDGMPEAQHDLAAIYTAGHGGVEQNYERASLWFREAAENGIANANYNLGVLHHQGLGVQKDVAQAITWYKRAAQMDHGEAAYNLGIAHIEGIGVMYDPATAAQYFRKAAVQGIMEAAYNLGLIYENGLLGSVNPEQALVWYKTAADQGSPEAKSALEQLAKALDMKLGDVNRMVESIRAAEDAAKSSGTSSPQKPDNRAAIEPVINEQAVRVASIQTYLNDFGLYPGPSDGIIGPQTSDAIRSYQRQNGLEVTGVADDDLLGHMTDMRNEVGSRAQ